VALGVAGIKVLSFAPARAPNTALASLPLHAAPASASPADFQFPPPALTSTLRTHCLDCHDGVRGKGGFDLNAVLDGAQPSELRAVRARLVRQDMPPIEEAERPSTAEYAAMIAAIDAAVPPARREVPLVRRLNRWQVANSIRDTIGRLGAETSAATASSESNPTNAVARTASSTPPPTFAQSLRAVALATLPADDVGEGFDTTASTLALPPLLVEKFLVAAEAVAAAAVPPPSQETTQDAALGSLERRGQGGQHDGVQVLASNGSLTANFTVTLPGTYRFEATCSASRAGPELAQAAVLVDDSTVLSQAWDPPEPNGAAAGHASGKGTTPSGRGASGGTAPPAAGTASTAIPFERVRPGTLVWQGPLEPGPHRIGVAFLNDYYNPNEPNPAARDRNLHLHAMRLVGPLEPTTPTPFQRWATEIAGKGSTTQQLRRVATALATELFRAPVEDRDGQALARTAIEAAGGSKAPFDDQLRALVTAVLVDPRFLLRVEAPTAAGRSVRNLSGSELASRLAFFIWASVPDRALRDAASRGELSKPGPLRAQIQRMLADPRADALAERFFTQWLGIDGLELRQFDPAIYPGLDARMLTLMQQETRELCGRVVRGELPVRALLDSTESAGTQELRVFYEGAGAPRPPGIFGHGSVLAATSNPTRTSPVKRGKWVLEALLDQAPPPPPPGVPQLPEGATNTEHRSMRELMAMHRANPDCASCHVRMDAIGLAFERFDANGRTRTMVDGHAVEDTTELPGGATIDGVPGVATMVGAGTAFERSLARRLLVYALGRGTAEADDPLVAELAARLARDRSFESLVMGIAMSDAFQQRRGAPSTKPLEAPKVTPTQPKQ